MSASLQVTFASPMLSQHLKDHAWRGMLNALSLCIVLLLVAPQRGKQKAGAGAMRGF